MAGSLEACQEELAGSRAETQLVQAQAARVKAEHDAAASAASLQTRLKMAEQEEKRGALETELCLVKETSAMENTAQEGAIQLLAMQAQRRESEAATEP